MISLHEVPKVAEFVESERGPVIAGSRKEEETGSYCLSTDS